VGLSGYPPLFNSGYFQLELDAVLVLIDIHRGNERTGGQRVFASAAVLLFKQRFMRLCNEFNSRKGSQRVNTVMIYNLQIVSEIWWLECHR
jgi:hypothetical protein